VAWHRRVLRVRRVDRGLDPPGADQQVAERAERAAAALGGGARIEVDDVPGRETVAQRPHAVDLPQRHRHLGDHVRLAEVAGRHHPPGQELGDERGRVVEERDDLGPDADRARGGSRLALARAVDPEQARVLACQAHDDVAAAEAHAQVVVGDAAAERLGRRLRLAEQVHEPGGQARSGGLRGRAHVIIRTTGREALARARAGWRQQGPGGVIARTYPTAASASSAERNGEGILERRAA
jgi:hypothetical protein